MAETINTGELAVLISEDIFCHFFWQTHPKHDDNFTCNSERHLSDGKRGQRIKTHPGDVVFSYDDPYLGKKIYLHTDLKSYGKDSINSHTLRKALRSLCMTVECAQESAGWRKKYSVESDEHHEVRGMLFVYNHDNGYEKLFYDAINGVDTSNLPIAQDTTLHYLGPQDIQRLYSIVNDIIRLKGLKQLPEEYTFYYPDKVMYHRHGDVWNQAATIESLTGPYFVIKHGSDGNKINQGYLIYYNRPGNEVDEFVYFFDTLSRYQMLESGQEIRIRITSPTASDDLKSIFQTAKRKYSKSWGFDPIRQELLDSISINRITNVTSTYNPGDVGWKE
nr:hypothetical protein [uncultured Methylophaga sp.]